MMNQKPNPQDTSFGQLHPKPTTQQELTRGSAFAVVVSLFVLIGLWSLGGFAAFLLGLFLFVLAFTFGSNHKEVTLMKQKPKIHIVPHPKSTITEADKADMLRKILDEETKKRGIH